MIEDMRPVAPYWKYMSEALRRLPARYKYQGFGVRVLNAEHGYMRAAWEDFKNHFAKGRTVNFHSVCSFGRDENLLQDFINQGSKYPVIVLKCENIVGYLIEEFSMISRMRDINEGEVLMEAPSFFKVKSQPIKIQNFVIVEVEYDLKTSQIMAYLPYLSNDIVEKEQSVTDAEEQEDALPVIEQSITHPVEQVNEQPVIEPSEQQGREQEREQLLKNVGMKVLVGTGMIIGAPFALVGGLIGGMIGGAYYGMKEFSGLIRRNF